MWNLNTLICTEEVCPNDDDNPLVPPASADIPAASKPAERKFQQKRRNITTKTVIVNLPNDFNDPSSPNYQMIHIRGFKFVISSNVINGFLGNVIDVDYSPSSLSTDVLASVLSGGTLSTWLVNGIPAVALSIKYAILHKIGIANWFPSSHASSVSAALGTFLYRIYNDNKDSHVADIDHDVRPSSGPRVFDTSDWDESAEGFFIDRELAICIVNALTAESRALTNSINMLSERRLEIDALIQHLKTFASSTSRRESTTD
ncbi:envelope-like protein [Cucumis melo var. makuwa]|uniref:Envelope-like protein n=1 Tax=Cucumis melo var. makuwa TaxID=1194695 RepID=A0A5D3CIZ1_CUCMM|nr:envelope-like protein [Cucumis melo var. makuwa]